MLPRSFTLYPSDGARPDSGTGACSTIGVLLETQPAKPGLPHCFINSVESSSKDHLPTAFRLPRLRLAQSRSTAASFYVSRAAGIEERVDMLNKKKSASLKAGSSPWQWISLFPRIIYIDLYIDMIYIYIALYMHIDLGTCVNSSDKKW